MRKTHAGNKGFSLIELCVVIAIVGFLAVMGSVFSTSAIGRSSALSERDLFVSLLIKTRAKALSNVNETPQGVYANATCYKFFEGNAGTPPACTASDIPKSASFTGTYRFQQLTGNALTGAGVTTVAFGGASYAVDINAAGRINW